MEQLTRITYVSRASFKPFKKKTGIEPNVARILSESRRNNIRHNLVGVLYYGDGCFFQCLEGTSDDIDELLASLKRDSRHGELEILSRSAISERSFHDWSMKYVSIDEQVQQLLKKNGLQKFDPYQFSPEMIRQLIDMFHQMAESVSPAEVEQHAQLVDAVAQTAGSHASGSTSGGQSTTQPTTQQWDGMIKVTGIAAAVVLGLIGVGLFVF